MGRSKLCCLELVTDWQPILFGWQVLGFTKGELRRIFICESVEVAVCKTCRTWIVCISGTRSGLQCCKFLSLLMLPPFNLQNTQIIGLSYRGLCEDERSTAGILYRSDWQITVSSTRFASLLPDDACEQLWQHAVLCATWPRRNSRDALSIWSLRCSLAIQAYQSSHGSLGQTVGRLGLAIAGSIGGNRFPFLSKFVQVGQLWSSFVLWVKCCVALQPLCRTLNNILS